MREGISLNKAYYWLSLSSLSSTKKNLLLKHFTIEELWDNFEKSTVIKNYLGDKYYSELLRFCNLDYLDSRLSRIAESGIRLLTPASVNYPELLAQSEVSPPQALYYKGDIKLASSPSIAVVGSRKSTAYGKQAAERIAGELCDAGLTVVSGLATGIDGFAHSEALRRGGKTVAVLGNGLEKVSPVSHVNLYERICEDGLVMTEYEPQFSGTKYSFPERNRILSGISLGVVVVEAGQKSGALITASYALEQNRELFCVPGSIFSTASSGTNDLIKQGARLVTCGKDICEALGLEPSEGKAPLMTLTEQEKSLCDLISLGEISYDEIVEKLKITPSDLSAMLTDLEIRGIIRKLKANTYVL